LRISRLCAFRAEIPQAVWLFAALDRTIERRIKSNSDDRMLELCFFSKTREAVRAAPEGRRGLAVAKSRVLSQFEFSALGAKLVPRGRRPAERA
jgi:hypothetical protein